MKDKKKKNYRRAGPLGYACASTRLGKRTKDAILHDLNKPGAQRFKFLSQALNNAWEDKATGYIVTPASEIINIKNGKRAGIGKKWVPCNVGVEKPSKLVESV